MKCKVCGEKNKHIVDKRICVDCWGEEVAKCPYCNKPANQEFGGWH